MHTKNKTNRNLQNHSVTTTLNILTTITTSLAITTTTSLILLIPSRTTIRTTSAPRATNLRLIVARSAQIIRIISILTLTSYAIL
jgi:hypothetical protein